MPGRVIWQGEDHTIMIAVNKCSKQAGMQLQNLGRSKMMANSHRFTVIKINHNLRIPYQKH